MTLEEAITIIETTTLAYVCGETSCKDCDKIECKRKEALTLIKELIKPKKKLGDKKCSEFICKNCPLKLIHRKRWEGVENLTLFEIIEKFKLEDKELYDLMFNRLNVEVKENEN